MMSNVRFAVPPTGQVTRLRRRRAAHARRSASAPAPRCSASSTPCCCGRCRSASPDRLVWIENEGTGGLSARTTRADTFKAWREENTSFEALAGYFAFFDFGRRQTLTGAGEPDAACDQCRQYAGVHGDGCDLDSSASEHERRLNSFVSFAAIALGSARTSRASRPSVPRSTGTASSPTRRTASRPTTST